MGLIMKRLIALMTAVLITLLAARLAAAEGIHSHFSGSSASASGSLGDASSGRAAFPIQINPLINPLLR
jgi:hypothetical protein